MKAAVPILAVLALAGCNRPPAGGMVVIEPEVALTGDDLIAHLVEPIKDDDEDLLSLRWQWFLYSERDPARTTETVPSTVTRKGQVWRVEITPNDGKTDGPTLFAETTVQNTPPVATLALTPSQPTTLTDLVATIQVTDADDDDTSGTRITWLVDGIATDWSKPTVPAAETRRGETWRVEVTPSDGEEDGEMVTEEVVINNVSPIADSVAIAPIEAFKDTRLVASAAGSDHEADPLTWTYAWFVDGGEVKRGAEDWLDGTHFDKDDTVVVEATASDGFQVSNTVTSAELSILNSAPSLAGAHLDPSEATEETTLACVPDGPSDIDGDTVSFTYAWSIDGAAAPATSNTLNGDAFDKGMQVLCVITPTDGVDAGAPVRSASITIGNAAPRLASASILPAAPRTDDTLTATGTGASDPDGDDVSLGAEWFVNKASVAKTASLGGEAFKRGDSVQVELTPFDGEAYGTSVRSAAVTVSNTPPKITAVTLSPATAYTDTDLRGAASVVDADLDSISTTWSWTVNGVTQTEVSSVLASDKFSKGQRVQAWATADDGIDKTGPTGSNIVTILNSAPSAPTIAISPAAPTDRTDLHCKETTLSVDKDKDPLTRTFAWTRNYVTWTGSTTKTTYTGDTIPRTDLKGGEIWGCSVVVSDGIATAPKVSSGMVTIKATPWCGNGTRDPGEEYNPAPGPFKNVSVDAATCRWDFSKVEQLYCNSGCSWAGVSGCDRADADAFCKLKTDNRKSIAVSWKTRSAMAKAGFPCSTYGTYGTAIYTDRGVKAGTRDPTWQDTSIVADHGPGDVVTDVVCTNP